MVELESILMLSSEFLPYIPLEFYSKDNLFI